MKIKKSILFIIVILFPSISISADLFGAKPISLGEAYRALADDNSAIDYNPAGISQKKAYSIELSYRLANPDTCHLFHGSITDTITNDTIGAGLSFEYGNFPSKDEIEESKKTMQIKLGLSKEIWEELYFGLTTEYIQIKGSKSYMTITEGIPQLPQEKISNYKTVYGDEHIETILATDKLNNWGITLDTGILWKLSTLISLALVGQNLVPTDIKEIRRGIAPGVAIEPFPLLTLLGDLEIDIENDSKKGDINQHYGTEVRIKNYSLRAGYSRDKIYNDQFYSLGAAYKHQSGILEATFSQSINNTKNYMFIFSITTIIGGGDSIDSFMKKEDKYIPKGDKYLPNF